MRYTIKKYFSLLSIGLLLSQPLSAMHYFDRKLFVGCCIGALGTMGALFIKQRFFPGKPVAPKTNNPNPEPNNANIVAMLKTECDINGKGFLIDQKTKNFYIYNQTSDGIAAEAALLGKPKSYLVSSNCQSTHFDRQTGKRIDIS